MDENVFEVADSLAAVSAAAAAATSPAAAAAAEDEKRTFVFGVGGVGRCSSGDRATDPSAGLIISMRQLSMLGAVAGLAATAFDYEHGMAGFHWFQDWVR